MDIDQVPQVMKTARLHVDPYKLGSGSSQAAISGAASILRDGGLVAFPTETVYGLGASAFSRESVGKIFVAKGRPAWDPLIVHISDAEMLATVLADAPLTPSAAALMAAFWPGPLTLLLRKNKAVPPIVTAGRPLVGVRMPAHPVAHALIAAAGVPVAAPSANRFGRVSPTLAAHVLEDLDGRIDAVLDSGETTHGLESTVVDASVQPVIVYRPGVITLEDIRRVCEAVEWNADSATIAQQTDYPDSHPSPGISIRHYAPRARLVLIGGEAEDQAASFAEAVKEALHGREQVGILLPSNFLSQPLPDSASQAEIFDWGDWEDLSELAHRLFAGLRQLDAAGVAYIMCPLPPSKGIGIAIRDRLLKATRTE